MKRAILLLSALALLVCSAGQAKAGLVIYSDRATFLAAAGGSLAFTDFEALPGGSSYQTLNSSVDSSIPVGVNFSSTGGGSFDLFLAPGGFNGNSAITSNSLFGNFFGTPLIVDFGPAVTAVGTDVIPFDFTNSTGTIVINVREPGGAITQFDVTPPQGSAGFFGVIATAGSTIDQITFFPPVNQTNVGVDNFAFGQASDVTATPEPATLALLGMAGVTFGGYHWRRRKQTVKA